MIENLKCPECEGPMTSRKNSTSGQRFWGCNDYPRCHGTRDTDGESHGESKAPALRRTTLPSERARENDRQRWRQP